VSFRSRAVVVIAAGALHFSSSGCGSILGADFDDLEGRNASASGGTSSGGTSSGSSGSSGAGGSTSGAPGASSGAVGDCNGASCFGCCAGGVCKPGTATDACGANGGACSACNVIANASSATCSAARSCEVSSCVAGFVKCANGTKCCENTIKNGDFQNQQTSWTGWQKGDSEHAACAIVPIDNNNMQYAARLVSAYQTIGYQGCSLHQANVVIPQAPKVTLSFRFRDTDSFSQGKLEITLGTNELLRETCPIGAGWVTKTVDLTRFAGQTFDLTLENSESANGYSCEVDDFVIIAE
jgi:hypothetical protein